MNEQNFARVSFSHQSLLDRHYVVKGLLRSRFRCRACGAQWRFWLWEHWGMEDLVRHVYYLHPEVVEAFVDELRATQKSAAKARTASRN